MVHQKVLWSIRAAGLTMVPIILGQSTEYRGLLHLVILIHRERKTAKGQQSKNYYSKMIKEVGRLDVAFSEMDKLSLAQVFCKI